MNTILGTAFSITLGIWRLRVHVSIEDTELDDAREYRGIKRSDDVAA